MQERRRFARAEYAANVQWTNITSDKRGTGFVENISKDISAGGICLVLVKSVSLGDELRLKFTLPVNRDLNLKGKVRWAITLKDETTGTVKYHAGIEFLDIDDKDRDFLVQLVSDLNRPRH